MAIVYASKNGCIKELVMFSFLDRIASVLFVNGGLFLQLILEPSRRRTETPFLKLTTPTILKVIIFFIACPSSTFAYRRRR